MSNHQAGGRLPVKRLAAERDWFHQLPERSQVPDVEILSVFHSLGRLQNHGQMPEPAIIDKLPEGLQSHLPGPDSGVPVDAAATFAAAVVQVPDPQPTQAHRPIQLTDVSSYRSAGSRE